MVDQGAHQCAVEEVPEAAVEGLPEVVEDLVTGEEEEVEAVEEGAVGSVLAEAEEEEVVTQILPEQERSEGAVHSHVVWSLALHVQCGFSTRQL